MTNLGAMLTANIEREKQAAYDKEAALEQMRTPEAIRIYKLAQTFFDNAKAFFTESITNKEPVNSLFQQVGGQRYSGTEVNTHEEFRSELGYASNKVKTEPLSLSDPKKFAALWADFRKWAHSSGLEAYWTTGTDGGGMDEWWYLRVKALPANPRGGIISTD